MQKISDFLMLLETAEIYCIEFAKRKTCFCLFKRLEIAKVMKSVFFFCLEVKKLTSELMIRCVCFWVFFVYAAQFGRPRRVISLVCDLRLQPIITPTKMSWFLTFSLNFLFLWGGFETDKGLESAHLTMVMLGLRAQIGYKGVSAERIKLNLFCLS